jgi:mono/diheme cytochrome c family protein
VAALAADADPALVERGHYLAVAGDCGACHSAPGDKPMAGGLAVGTPIGAIISTNITPSKTAGIGTYTLAQFAAALRRGVRADGARLYPAMPYTAYAGVTDADVKALYAYFMLGVTPVDQRAPETHLPFPFNIRLSMMAWNLLFLDTKPFTPDPRDRVPGASLIGSGERDIVQREAGRKLAKRPARGFRHDANRAGCEQEQPEHRRDHDSGRGIDHADVAGRLRPHDENQDRRYAGLDRHHRAEPERQGDHHRDEYADAAAQQGHAGGEQQCKLADRDADADQRSRTAAPIALTRKSSPFAHRGTRRPSSKAPGPSAAYPTATDKGGRPYSGQLMLARPSPGRIVAWYRPGGRFQRI